MAVIKPFTKDQIRSATSLAHQSYLKELEKICGMREIAHSVVHEVLVPLIDSPYAFCVYEDGHMAGFIAGDPHTGKVSLFGHGYNDENAYKLYNIMYTELAERLVGSGLREHAVTVYRHDAGPIEAFFHNGFGMSKVHAIADLDSTYAAHPIGNRSVIVEALDTSGIERLQPLKKAFDEHLANSPAFVVSDSPLTANLLVLVDEGIDIGFLEWSPKRSEIISAYLKPEWRGRGLFNHLLFTVFNILKSKGEHCCSVTFDSMNPSSSAYWLKYFQPYAYELKRKI